MSSSIAGTGQSPAGTVPGILFIVSGPSGAGKTTISDAALKAFPSMTMSVSCTTRAAREGEVDGREYRFLGRERFDAMLAAGEFAEWAEVHGNRYGTPRAPIDASLAAGRDMLLDIDVQGAAQMRSSYAQAIAVFVLPPDRATMEARLRGRGTDSEATVARRLDNACREIAQAAGYDHLIVNRGRGEAIAEFEGIVRDAHAHGRDAMRRRRGAMSEEQLGEFLLSFERRDSPLRGQSPGTA